MIFLSNMNDFQLSPFRRSFFLGWNNTQPVAGSRWSTQSARWWWNTSPPCSHRLHQVIVTPLFRRLHGELRGKEPVKETVWKSWRWGCNHLGTWFFPYKIKREVPKIYTNICHIYNNGCMGKCGAIFWEQLLGDPFKGIQKFPLKFKKNDM